jgi:hypothetical protein
MASSRRTKTNEVNFAEFVRCPLRILAEYREPLELEAAKNTARWLLSAAFKDELYPLVRVREHYESEWVRMSAAEGLSTEEHRRIFSLVPRVARRLHDLATSFLVLHPVVPYSVTFGRSAVIGEYAVVIRPKRSDEPQILRLRMGCDPAVESKRRGPDVINILRWVHFRQWEAHLPRVRVLNYQVDTEDSWTDFFDEKTVRGYLQYVSANLEADRLHPSAGVHCETCKLPVCRMDGMGAFPSRG